MPTTIEPILVSLGLPEAILQIIRSAPLPEIGAGSLCLATTKELEKLVDRKDGLPETCWAGLWLLAGDLERSHRISQEIETASGSYWHGLMHRREGDYGNSKYWFRRAGGHPAIGEIEAVLKRRLLPGELDLVLEAGRFSPSRLTDCIERALRRSNAEEAGGLAMVAWIEWQMMFAYCYSE